MWLVCLFSHPKQHSPRVCLEVEQDPPFQVLLVRLFSPHQGLIDRFNTSPNKMH